MQGRADLLRTELLVKVADNSGNYRIPSILKRLFLPVGFLMARSCSGKNPAGSGLTMKLAQPIHQARSRGAVLQVSTLANIDLWVISATINAV
jgi:hypothetical protein